MRVMVSSENIQACSDYRIEEWFECVKNKEVVFVATDLQLSRLRWAHISKDINIESLEFRNKLYYFNEYSVIENCPWPEDLFGFDMKFAEKIVLESIKMRKGKA